MCSIHARNAAVATVLFLALLCTGALAQTAAPGAAQAASSFDKNSGGSGQAYPVKPIRLEVGFPASASSEIVGRMLGQKIAEQLGEQIVPDNRAGARGKAVHQSRAGASRQTQLRVGGRGHDEPSRQRAAQAS